MPKQASAKRKSYSRNPRPNSRNTTNRRIRCQIGWLAYLFAWPMVNSYNRLLAYEKLPEPGLAGGVLRLRRQINSACFMITLSRRNVQLRVPNQDVVYGQSVLALDP